MRFLHDSGGRVRWIAIVAIAGLIAGLGAAWWYARPPRPRPVASAPHAGTSLPDMPDDAIHRGLKHAPDDSTAIKTRWVDEVPGFDLAGMDSARREIFVRFANAERCTCGCGYTLAACRAYDSSCEVSTPRVQSLLDSVRAGRIRSAAGIRKRPT